VLLLLALDRLFSASLRRVSLFELLCGLWLLGQLGMMALCGYRPLRYYAPALVPLAMVAGAALEQVAVARRGGARRWSRRLLRTSLLLYAALPAALITAVRLGIPFDPLGLGRIPALPWPQSLVLLLLWAPALVAVWRPGVEAALRRRAGAVLLGAFLVVQLGGLAAWLARPRYEVREASRYLREELRDAVIAGQWAPELCLETPHRAVPLWKGFVNDRDPFRRLGITHVLSWEYALGDELALQRSWFPEEMAAARLVTTFTIKGTPVHLFAVGGGE